VSDGRQWSDTSATDVQGVASRRQPVRRSGDTIAIPGDYQARALREGFVVQRFWHTLKLALVDRALLCRPGARVLDVGCGSGVVAEFLANRAERVDAVDANPSAIEYARAATTHPNVHYHLGLVDQMAFDPETFDHAVCLEVIEHLFEEQAVDLLRQLRTLLKPGGELLVTTPNYRSLWPAIERTMDMLHLAPRLQDDQHVTHFTRHRLRRIGLRAGLSEVQVGRFCGVAPFVSAMSWKLAGLVDRLETRLASPLGNVLFALWRSA